MVNVDESSGFIDLFVGSLNVDSVAQALAQLSNVDELCKATGECKIITRTSATNLEEFHKLLKNS